jgi:hypothetical protein
MTTVQVFALIAFVTLQGIAARLWFKAGILRGRAIELQKMIEALEAGNTD